MEDLILKNTPDLPDAESVDGTGLGSGNTIFLNNFVNGLVTFEGCERLAPWWSWEREKQLRDIAYSNEILAGILFTTSTMLVGRDFSVVPRNSTVQFHADLAQQYETLLRYSLYNTLEKFILDLMISDNGAFMLITGNNAPVADPLFGPPTGLQHLDSMLCTRTRNETYPVVYTDPNNGTKYPIHYSRIIFFAQMPSTDYRYNGIGISSVSRLFKLSQLLNGGLDYDLEQLGLKDSAKILFGAGISKRDIDNSIDDNLIASGNAGMQGAKTLVLASRDSNSKLNVLRLKEGSAGKERREEIEALLSLAALSLGVSLFVLLESSQSSSTRGAAKESVKLTSSKLLRYTINKLIVELTLKFLPPSLEVVLSEDLEAIDNTKTRNELNRALTRNNNLANKSTSVRIERERMVQTGELSVEQFVLLELEDERLQNGLSISTLYYDQDTRIQQWLTFSGVDNPLDIQNNDAETMIEEINVKLQELVTKRSSSTSSHITRFLTEMIYALQWLENQYQDSIQDIDVIDFDDDAGLEYDTERNLQAEDNRDRPNENTEMEKMIKGEITFAADKKFTTSKQRKEFSYLKGVARELWSDSISRDEFINKFNGQDDYDKQCVESLADYILENQKGVGALTPVLDRVALFVS